MRYIDELLLELPFAGVRRLRDLLRAEGFTVYRKPNTSRKAPGPTIWTHLPRTLTIIRSNDVWAMDISYIPKARGFVYLAVVIFGRLSYRK